MTSIRQIMAEITVNRLELRVLLRNITGFNDAYLISHDDYVLTSEQQQQLSQALARLKKGEPLAYILGYKEFYSRKFKVTEATLIPRPETELLVDKIISCAPVNSAILDLGTGSGCIAISCKLERPDLKLTAVDISAEALNIAQANAKELNTQITFIQSNWFQNITGKFAIIASNPPYISANDQHLINLPFEPLGALTDFADGLSAIRNIITTSISHLSENGWLLLEHGYDQGQNVRELLTLSGFEEVGSLRDYAGIERISYGQLKRKE